MQIFDGHTHSNNSLDGVQTVDELCQSAITHGLDGVTVTDHCDMWYYDSTDTYKRISASVTQTDTAREKYSGILWVGKGVEMAEYLFDFANAEKILKLTDYDVVLGSVHCVACKDWNDAYSRIDFGNTIPEEKILDFLNRYFSEMQKMIDNARINVLAHLTCPLRYINGKYGRNIDALLFAEPIEQILKTIIDRGIALELNTSGINTGWGEFMPTREILKIYRKLGGELITVGSDAHMPGKVGNGLENGLALLKETGFRYYTCYRRQKPHMIKI